jgi:UDP-N-acetylmuramate: L-alanyl-gamma-D-glutamyl-meso-diaminopimelate ligase
MPHVPHPDLRALRHVHLIGVAGTAMGSFAGMLHDAGYRVTGSDRAIYPPMSNYLEKLGVRVYEGFVRSNLEEQPDLVIVGNVVRAEYDEAQGLLELDLPYCSFPEALAAFFLEDRHSVVLAGTHGKTTTTALTAHLLEAAGRQPGFLIGGVALNFDRTARAPRGPEMVLEGDEYDTAFFDKGPKFLHYRPKTVVITSIEFDHADIYRDLDHVADAFRQLIARIPPEGRLLVRSDDPLARRLAEAAACPVDTYGPDGDWDGKTLEVDPTTGTTRFELLHRGAPVGVYRSLLVGQHNLANQVAAAAVAIGRGVRPEQLEAGFATFRGVKRRQEVLGEPGGVTVLDDFAHHPTAVRATLAALRERFGQRRLWVLFEPRSATSRRAVFQQAYAEAFDDADQIAVSSPYDTSRIPEAERFQADRLVQDLTDRGKVAWVATDVPGLARTVAARALPGDVVAIFSNGAFDGLHQRLLSLLATRFEAA